MSAHGGGVEPKMHVPGGSNRVIYVSRVAAWQPPAGPKG
jgi:hypothetical protein